MLDLNVNITATDLSYDDEKAKALEAEKLPQMEEDSGTSNSSVVNAEEAPTPSNAADEDSSNTTSSYIFDILKKEKDGLCNAYGAREETQSPELATRSLFPVTGGKEAECGFGLSSSSRPQWLNLSFTDSGGQAELRIMQQQQQTRQQPPPPPPPQPRKSRRGPRSRSSQYRGVTFYRRTGRWESHIWDCGKQVYLGGFDTAHSAAKAYDRAAIKFRGVDADINFSLSDYEEDMKQMRHLNKEEFVHVLRRQSNGASRASSKYRGVTLPKCGQWETGRGQFLGKKVFEKAAPPAIKCNGREGVANFDPGTYEGEIILDASIEGRGHNLDLSLGISQPSNGQKGNGNLGGFQLGGNAFEMSNKERPMGNGSASGPVGGQPAHVLAMVSKHPAIYSGIYPGFLQKHEEMVTDHHQRVVPQAVSSPRFTNWAWQIQGNSSNVTPVPVFSVAASSGFSSSSIASTTPPIPSANNQLPPNLPANYSAYNFCLPFPTME